MSKIVDLDFFLNLKSKWLLTFYAKYHILAEYRWDDFLPSHKTLMILVQLFPVLICGSLLMCHFQLLPFVCFLTPFFYVHLSTPTV